MLALGVLVPLISILGCAGWVWHNESKMPPQSGHPFRGHLDSASERSTADELGWAAATAFAHARGDKEPGAEPCEIGERLVTGRLATFEASTAALAALADLEEPDPGVEPSDFKILAHDGSPYASQKRKVSSSDRWRLDATFDGRLSFHFSWDTKTHVLTLTKVTRDEPPAATSPTPR